ncbi:transcriptional regulator, TetR family [Acinetobacter marinus]|uniref:Transcriptional regulator, TetR family n=1 Tax=Acinetobacter marinus TaxID=281375 RepID=A0A1G6JU89_9GAMM|nr:TetR/AcrR family transcriptional regulator [Acinetobacter marinus]SDC21556.1 transcriptional regulator, TetR family [Acinetobacter marinus]
MRDLPLDEYRKKSQKSLISEQERSNSQLIYEALFAQLLSNGYGNINLQQLSKLTGISRTTLYRRWSSIDALIVDAIADKIQDEIAIPTDLEPVESLKVMLQQLAEFLQSPLGRAFLQAALAIKDEVTERKREALWQVRYQQIRQAFVRLLPTGKAHHDIDAIVKMTLGSIYFQIFIQNQQVDDAYIESILNHSMTLIQSK